MENSFIDGQKGLIEILLITLGILKREVHKFVVLTDNQFHQYLHPLVQIKIDYY